jgi:hypothetical protein
MTSWQKKSIVLAVLALVPAYFFASGRYETNMNAIDQSQTREKQLVESDLKLLEVCKETGLNQSDSYGSNAALCRQAQERHKLQEKTLEKLEADRHHLSSEKFWNFLWGWLLLNAAAQLVLRWTAIKQKLEG